MACEQHVMNFNTHRLVIEFVQKNQIAHLRK